MNIDLSRQSKVDLLPSQTISSSQYNQLSDFKNNDQYYTLKVHFKRGIVQDYVMTSIPIVLLLNFLFSNIDLYPFSALFYKHNFSIQQVCLLVKMVTLSVYE